ncbi:melanoma-associated antigen 10 [Tupaia chinensis]|uniref:melanoma-associated antigen 10 n=1 Tax=Tupaia chinensis TaxID=246437 RepID=UPI0003C8E73C|nr:melanoma-associated antigen 10 [Tupaia chinensis]
MPPPPPKRRRFSLEEGLGPQDLSTSEEVAAAAAAAVTLKPLQYPQRACCSPTAMTSALFLESEEGSRGQEEEGLSSSQALPEAESSLENEIEGKVSDLVHFLLHKYRVKEPTTKEEMLSSVIQNYQDFFPEILSKASECLLLVFGIDVKEVDPIGQSYHLATTLGLAYDGMPSDDNCMPKTGLLVIVMGVILMQGNRATEGKVREVLNMMEVYAGIEHVIYGEPGKLLTEEWVRENYLEYRQVPGSDPACYEFLWGPRAHAETSKMKVLEYLAKIYGSEPTAFPLWYEEALREEEERAQATMAIADDSTAMAAPSSSATATCMFVDGTGNYKGLPVSEEQVHMG